MTHWFRKNLIKIYMVLGFLYLFVPIIYTFIFSFNDYITHEGEAGAKS